MLSPEVQSPFDPHWSLYPKTYVAQRISTSFPLIEHIDGDLDKDVWRKQPWSDIFDDIRGPADSPSDERPPSSCRTRFKAIFDDEHLYIGAILESDFETQAHFTERNSPIYQKDSDFEVFVDPVGSCQNYKELEVNAINTIWNLLLDKPYADGGSEHSGRIAKPGDDQYYEVYKQKTATKLLKGKLNNPDSGSTWSVEIALSYEDLLAHIADQGYPPKIGDMWRINFSRVERKGEINWTWQPQISWDATNRRYAGWVDMHRPDAWGYIVFGGHNKANEKEKIPRDQSWPSRLAAMNVYYGQRKFNEMNGYYAENLQDLSPFIDLSIVDPFSIEIARNSDGKSYTASIIGNGYTVTVSHDRHLQVEEGNNDYSIITDTK